MVIYNTLQFELARGLIGGQVFRHVVPLRHVRACYQMDLLQRDIGAAAACRVWFGNEAAHSLSSRVRSLRERRTAAYRSHSSGNRYGGYDHIRNKSLSYQDFCRIRNRFTVAWMLDLLRRGSRLHRFEPAVRKGLRNLRVPLGFCIFFNDRLGLCHAF